MNYDLEKQIDGANWLGWRIGNRRDTEQIKIDSHKLNTERK